MPQAEKCSDMNGSILTDERELIEQWKLDFDAHLNDAESAGNEVQVDIHHKAVSKNGIGAGIIKMGQKMICMNRKTATIGETEQLPEQ